MLCVHRSRAAPGSSQRDRRDLRDGGRRAARPVPGVHGANGEAGHPDLLVGGRPVPRRAAPVTARDGIVRTERVPARRQPRLPHLFHPGPRRRRGAADRPDAVRQAGVVPGLARGLAAAQDLHLRQGPLRLHGRRAGRARCALDDRRGVPRATDRSRKTASRDGAVQPSSERTSTNGSAASQPQLAP